MGYGPLVRSLSGLSGLWAYPDQPASFSDASTVYPDHIAARLGALAVVAALSRRRRTGRGAHIQISQAEVILGQLAPAFVQESVSPGSIRCVGSEGPGDAPRGLFPSAGDDEWLVIDSQGDDSWLRLCTVLGRPELAERFTSSDVRVANRAEIDEIVTAWTRERTPHEAMGLLQDAGVAAGAMNRVADLPKDPQLAARGFLAVQPQPQIAAELPAEARHAHFAVLPDPELRPGPLRFEHTADLAERLLGLSRTEIGKLAEAGVLQLPKES